MSLSTPTSLLPIAAGLTPDSGEDAINAALSFVREHLGMDVAYLSEFVGDNLVFRAVDAPGFEDLCFVGGSMPLDQVYCRHILAGRLPELIPDTADVPFCQTIPVTSAIPIGAHVSIPIRRSDGTPYGMFCCLSRKPQKDLTARDLKVMRAFADLSANQVNEKLALRVRQEDIRNTITQVMEQQAYTILFQPIMDALERRPKGFEALSRFKSDPYRPPNLWFEDAALVGLQTELEIHVMQTALSALNVLPPEIYVSVNASPSTVETGRLADVFRDWPSERIVLEITEHCIVSDYDTLVEELNILRFSGVRLAIDDAGAGYSGLQHIVRLIPDIIKLDMSLTSEIDKDLVRRSLASALVNFAHETNAAIVAEGIETVDELETLQTLGVPLAQGYYLGKPGDLETAKAWFDGTHDVADSA